MPSPERTAQADQLHTASREMLDYYVSAIEHDMNEYVKKNGKSMDFTYAHNDLTLVLARSIKPSMLAAILAEAILREIQRKASGGR